MQRKYLTKQISPAFRLSLKWTTKLPAKFEFEFEILIPPSPPRENPGSGGFPPFAAPLDRPASGEYGDPNQVRLG